MDVGQAHAGMDGEVVDALFALLDQRVLVHFPAELDGIAVYFLKRLIDRHGADRDRRVADDPFARCVDVAAGGEVHHRVGTPADRPHHFLDFLLDRRCNGAVADIGVYLGEEVTADDHRLKFSMVDVRRNDRAPARDFAAYEFRRDESGYRCAKALTIGKCGFRALQLLLASQVLTLGDVDHFLGDDAGTRPFELGYGLAIQRAPRLRHVRETARHMLAGNVAVIDRLHLATHVFFDAAALFHPGDART